jgi:hypothetical protein
MRVAEAKPTVEAAVTGTSAIVYNRHDQDFDPTPKSLPSMVEINLHLVWTRVRASAKL